MSTLANWLPNYKQRYGDFTDPLPEENTLADFFPFVKQDQRPGVAFNFPIVVSLEHGQTADVSGTAFAFNSAVDSVLQNAQIDGATLGIIGNIPYDVSFKSRNGAGNGSTGGAFRTAFELKTDLLMKSMEFYREVSLLYGCGSGTTITCDIGVVISATGSNLGSGMVVLFSKASWAPGIWSNMLNAKVDFYAADGLTPVAGGSAGASVTSVNADTAQVGFSLAASTAVIAAGHRVVMTGWRQKSCVGCEGILLNTGTIFNIPAGTYPMWKALQIDLAGAAALNRARVLGIMARLFPNGLTAGGSLFVSGPTFADLAEEADSLQRYTGNTDEVKRQGANQLVYKSPAGEVTVKLHKYMKQGEAFFFPTGNGKRVGSTDITFRGEGQDWFFLELPTNAGCQLRIMSNQASILTMPYRCAIIKGILNSTTSGAVGG
jgi:hypothetical protein